MAKEGDFQTYFMGWALSGMRRDLWQKVPFAPNMPRKWFTTREHVKSRVDGFGSDWFGSFRLERLGVTIWTNRDAQIIHLATMKGSIMGSKSETFRYL